MKKAIYLSYTLFLFLILTSACSSKPSESQTKIDVQKFIYKQWSNMCKRRTQWINF